MCQTVLHFKIVHLLGKLRTTANNMASAPMHLKCQFRSRRVLAEALS